MMDVPISPTPSPSERLVPWIMQELSQVPRANIVIINGTGSHRANTRDELIQMLGAEVVETVQIVNHNAFDDTTLTHLGRTGYGGEVPSSAIADLVAQYATQYATSDYSHAAALAFLRHCAHRFDHATFTANRCWWRILRRR